MKKNIYLVFAVLMLCCIEVYGQKSGINPFRVVEVPDSLRLKLLQIAYSEDSLTVGTPYIFNLINRKDYDFKNGIYSFQGRGPHFPRRIFIHYNGKTFIFKGIGAFELIGILEEYVDCIKLLKLSAADGIKYLKVISNYLDEELGKTYGAEIK